MPERHHRPRRPTACAPGGVTLVDVREQHEWDEGHIPGALLAPKSHLEEQHRGRRPGPGHARDPVLRRRRAIAVRGPDAPLAGLHRRDLDGRRLPAVEAARAARSTTPVGLTAEQKQRYSRHLLIPEVGPEGQAQLLGSKVLLIGAGGLGSPAALYLAAAGVGTLGIVDFDVVDAVQPPAPDRPHHRPRRLRKTASAAQTIGALNPDVNVVPHDEMLVADNVERLIAGLRRDPRRHGHVRDPLHCSTTRR